MSSLQYQQSLQIQHFFSSYSIIQSKQEKVIISSISSPTNTYLIRTLSIQKQQECNLLQIIQTLTQHEQFSCKNLYNLLSFQLIHPSSNLKHNKNMKIRAIYQYGLNTLKSQIIKRKDQNHEYFQQDAIWGLLYSMLVALEYLEQKNIIYGVLGSQRVFLDKTITIIDPSSTAIDPYEIQQLIQENNRENNNNNDNHVRSDNNRRIYSPQLLNPNRQISSIDMFKSDVFTCGLIILQSCLLNPNIILPLSSHHLLSYNQFISHYFTQLDQLNIYSQQLINLLKNMLSYQPQQRLTFGEILIKIGGMFEVSMGENDNVEVMKCDKEDINNKNQWDLFYGMSYEYENVDLLIDVDDVNVNMNVNVNGDCYHQQYQCHNRSNKHNQNKSKMSSHYMRHYQYQQQQQQQQPHQQHMPLTQYQQARQKFFNTQSSLPFNHLNDQNTSIQLSAIQSQSFRQSIQNCQNNEDNFHNHSNSHYHYQNINDQKIIKKSQQKCENKSKISKSKEIKEKLVKNNYGGEQKYEYKQYKETQDNNNNKNNYKRHNRSNTVGQSINHHANNNSYNKIINTQYDNININNNYNNNSINKYNNTSKPIKTARQNPSYYPQHNQNYNKITFNYYKQNKQNQLNPQNNQNNCQNNHQNNPKSSFNKNINILSNKQNLFTDPKIMSMIKNDMKRIQQQKLALKSDKNIQ